MYSECTNETRTGQSQDRGLGQQTPQLGAGFVRHPYFPSLKIDLYLLDIQLLSGQSRSFYLCDLAGKLKTETDMTVAGPCHSGLESNTAPLNLWLPAFFINKMLHPMILQASRTEALTDGGVPH